MNNQVSVANIVGLLLEEGCPRKEYAIKELQYRLNASTHNTETCLEIFHNGGIIPLLSLLPRVSMPSRESIADILFSLTSLGNDVKAEMGRQGAINTLMGLMESGSSLLAKTKACNAFFNIMIFRSNHLLIMEDGGLERLLRLIEVAPQEITYLLVGALASASWNKANKPIIGSSGAIPLVIKLLEEGDSDTRHNATAVLINLLTCSDNKPLISRAGGIKVLIRMLEDKSNSTKGRAAQALDNFVRDKYCCIDNSVAREGGIEALVKVLSLGHKQASDKATCALWEMANNSNDNAYAVAKAGGIKPLLRLMSGPEGPLKKFSARILGILASFDDLIPQLVGEKQVRVLINLLSAANQEGRANVAAAVCSLTPAQQAIFIKQGGIKPLVTLLDDVVANTQAANTLWNLSLISDSHRSIVDAGGIEPLIRLLSGVSMAARVNAAAALNQLAKDKAGTVRSTIATKGGIKPLVELMIGGSYLARENAAGVLEGMTRVKMYRLDVVKEGGVMPLVGLMASGSLCARKTLKRLNNNVCNPLFFEGRDGEEVMVALNSIASCGGNKKAKRLSKEILKHVPQHG